jgi:hypothetical protein
MKQAVFSIDSTGQIVAPVSAYTAQLFLQDITRRYLSEVI